MFVAVIDVVGERGDQFAEAGHGEAANLALGALGEESLDDIQFRRGRRHAVLNDRARRDIQHANSVVVPWRSESRVIVRARPGFLGRPGCVRLSASI